jgi:hypothetical protein
MQTDKNQTPDASNSAKPSLKRVVLERILIGGLFLFLATYLFLQYVGVMPRFPSMPGILALIYRVIGHIPFMLIIALVGLAWIYWGVSDWFAAQKNKTV